MGRVARGIVRGLASDSELAITLLAGSRDRASLHADFPELPVVPTRKAERRGAFDVVWYPFNGMRFTAAAPALVTMHDAFAFTEPHPQYVARRREQAPIRRAARRAARIVTVSAWSRGELARELGLPRERIAVVPTAPDAFFFPGAGDVVPAPLEENRFVLVVGAREARKNARLALEACARALRGPVETLAIVGELARADRTRALALGVRCGEIAASDETLRALYRNANVVLVPSFAEGFGLVATEALACGAAVIAADAAALPEATQGAAVLLDPRDVAAWSACIRRFLDDPSLVERQRERARAGFAFGDRTSHVRDMRALLRQTAGDGARANDARDERRETFFETRG